MLRLADVERIKYTDQAIRVFNCRQIHTCMGCVVYMNTETKKYKYQHIVYLLFALGRRHWCTGEHKFSSSCFRWTNLQRKIVTRLSHTICKIFTKSSENKVPCKPNWITEIGKRMRYSQTNYLIGVVCCDRIERGKLLKPKKAMAGKRSENDVKIILWSKKKKNKIIM